MRFAEEFPLLKTRRKHPQSGSRGDFLNRESIAATRRGGMPIWREKIFIAMSRNANTASSHFHMPPNEVVELGACVEI